VLFSTMAQLAEQDPNIEALLLVDGTGASMAASEALAPSDHLRLSPGCADGACAGMTFDELVGVLGKPKCCWDDLDDKDAIECRWVQGMSGWFDPAPDAWPDGAGVLSGLMLGCPWDGCDHQGL